MIDTIDLGGERMTVRNAINSTQGRRALSVFTTEITLGLFQRNA